MNLECSQMPAVSTRACLEVCSVHAAGQWVHHWRGVQCYNQHLSGIVAKHHNDIK